MGRAGGGGRETQVKGGSCSLSALSEVESWSPMGVKVSRLGRLLEVGVGVGSQPEPGACPGPTLLVLGEGSTVACGP